MLLLGQFTENFQVPDPDWLFGPSLYDIYTGDGDNKGTPPFNVPFGPL